MPKNEMPFKISEIKLEKAKEQIKSGGKGICCAYNCSNKAVSKKRYLCHKHYARLLRKFDPVGVRFSQMKQKAKSRMIPFTIRIEWFRNWCVRQKYIVVKGNRGMNATVDRRCNAQGYHEWNIQIVTSRYNAKKGNKGSNGNVFSKPQLESTLEDVMNNYEHDGEDLPF